MTEDVKPHDASLAIWDIASPVVVNGRLMLKVGAKCAEGCSMEGQPIEIRDETGSTIARGTLGSTPWPATTALHWSEIDFPVSGEIGKRVCSAILLASEHLCPPAAFNFLVAPIPEHRVTVEVVERGEAAVPGAEVRFGPYRRSTDALGIAKIELPKGTYDLVAWKQGYQAMPKIVEVTSDVAVRIEIEVIPEPEQEYWMG